MKASDSLLEEFGLSAEFPVTGHAVREVSAESFAGELLQQNHLDATDILRLSLGLPSELPVRGFQGEDSRSVSLGLFVQGGCLHVRDVSLAYPLSTKVFAKFVKQVYPNFTCATLSVFTNLKSSLHQDRANDSSTVNLMFPLSQFSEGGVWFESAKGKVPFHHKGDTLWGEVLDVSKGLCFLDAPNCRHATLSWKGSRSVLVGYTADCTKLPPARELQTLIDAEFPLPKTLVPEPAVSVWPLPPSPVPDKVPLGSDQDKTFVRRAVLWLCSLVAILSCCWLSVPVHRFSVQ